MSGLLRRILGKGGRPAPLPSTASDYDPAPAEAAYRRLLQLAQQLRASGGGLAAAAARVEMREAQLRRSLDEYERIAQTAIANGRTIQAESALASAEAAQAAIDALAPQAAEIKAQSDELERGVARLESEAATLRARLDASQTAQAVSGARARLNETRAALHGHLSTVDAVVRDAEDEALRLEGLARGIAELYGGGPAPP